MEEVFINLVDGRLLLLSWWIAGTLGGLMWMKSKLPSGLGGKIKLCILRKVAKIKK